MVKERFYIDGIEVIYAEHKSDFQNIPYLNQKAVLEYYCKDDTCFINIHSNKLITYEGSPEHILKRLREL